MSATLKLEGFRELEQELAKLGSHTTRRASARRALRKAAQPMADIAQSMAPRRRGHLADNIIVRTRASGPDAARQAFGQVLQAGGTRQEATAALRDVRRESSSLVTMYVGPGRHPQAITQEFGTWFHPPQPFLRPAWDQDQRAMLDRLKAELWVDIQKTVARAERRAARLAARG